MLTSIALAFSLAFPASSTSGDLPALVRERAQAAAQAPALEEVWQSVRALVAAAGDDGRGLDSAVDAALAQSDPIAERSVLLLTATRLHGTEPDVGALTKRLVPLISAKDDEVARGAAGLFSDSAFHALKDNELEDLLTKLGDVAKDGDRSPELRLACASALYMQGRGAAQRDARKQMMSFMESQDPHLRALGALALARVGDVETGRTELERMRQNPDDDGLLADSYLKQEEIRRLYERRVKNALDYAKKASEGATDAQPDHAPKVVENHELKLVEQVMRLIETTSLEGEKVKREDLIDAALDGMLRSLDEHSSFMGSKAYKEFTQDLLEPEYGGIGAYVGEDPEDHLFTIRQPIYSGPAYQKGLHSDDKVVRIDDWPTFNGQGTKPLDDIIKRLKGKPGTKVKLYIWRRGMDPGLIDRPTEDMAVEIEREEITIPPVKADLLPGKIAQIELDSFTQVASQEVTAKLEEFKKQGMRAVILDLRQNSGGLLTEARDVANLFLPKRKLVVTTESRSGDPRKLYTAKDPLIPADMPVVVLVSRFSASASEIVSGALQDYQRATLVGQRTYGKGSVQELLPIPGEKDDVYEDENHNGRYDSWEKLVQDWNGNGEFDFAPRARMTVARYRLPSGRSIHKELAPDGHILSDGGVEPEVHVDPKRYDPTKLAEMGRLLRAKKLRAYVDQHWTANRDLFLELAAGDKDDVSQYPDFQAFYSSLDTTLSQSEVRMLTRRELRGRAQDERGSAFPDGGDFQEDPMLQAAIETALTKLGSNVAEIPEYATTFDPHPAKGDGKTDPQAVAVNLSDVQRTNLRHALTLLDEAKSGNGGLSADRLAEIERAVHAILDR